MDKYRGWGCFFGLALTVIGCVILRIAQVRTPEGSKLGASVIGGVVLLLAARFLWAAFTGRIPEWMVEMIDDPD